MAEEIARAEATGVREGYPNDRQPSFLREIRPVMAGSYRTELSGIHVGLTGAIQALGWFGSEFEQEIARSMVGVAPESAGSAGVFVPKQSRKAGVLFFTETAGSDQWVPGSEWPDGPVNAAVVGPNSDRQFTDIPETTLSSMTVAQRDAAWKPATMEEALRRLNVTHARHLEYDIAERLVGGHPDIAAFRNPDFCPEGYLLRQSPDGRLEVVIQQEARMQYDNRCDAARRVFRPHVSEDGQPDRLESWYETRLLTEQEV